MSTGYQADFIDNETVPLPKPGDHVRGDALNEGEPLDYSRFSILFSKTRHFAIYTAHHIDGDTLFEGGSGSQMPRRRFRPDPNISDEIQVDNKRGYSNNPWDRGHLIRRFSQYWGTHEEAREAVSESDYWTNIAPQHNKLHHSAWGKIENWMLEQANSQGQKACIFTGPINTPDDPEHLNRDGEIPIRIPAGFWKLMAVKHNGRLRAAGFLVWQRDYDNDNPVAFEPHLEQVRLTTLEVLTGLSFSALRYADPLLFNAGTEHDRGSVSGATRGSRPLNGIDSKPAKRPTAVNSPEDIVL